MKSMRPMPQTFVLIALGCLDLLTTVALVLRHGAAEANPLMAAILSKGLFAFVMTKLALLLAPVAILEWGRRFSPAFVLKACNAAIAAYICLYAAGVARVNLGPNVQTAYGSQDPRVWQQIRQTIEWKRAAGLLPPIVYEREQAARDALANQKADAALTRNKQAQTMPVGDSEM